MNINNIISSFNSIFTTSKTPAQDIPPYLVASNASSRSGLSPSDIASKVIQRLPEAGAYVGEMPDGSQNVMEGVIRIMTEEVVNALITDAKITIAFLPGEISIIGSGANAGGPVEVVGNNNLVAKANGVIQ